jgi:outer membrane protein W
MKKIGIYLFLFFISSTVLPKDNVRIGAYAGYFSSRDNTIQEVYTRGDITYGVKIGVRIWKGFSIWLSGTQFREVSETSLLGDITTLTLNPLTLSLRYTIPLGSVNPYLGGGYAYIYYKEKSDIGNVSGEGRGYSLDAGFEIKLSRRFHLDIGAAYTDVGVRPTGFDIQLGGLQAGISFLVIF